MQIALSIKEKKMTKNIFKFCILKLKNNEFTTFIGE